MDAEFVGFPKLYRWNREVIVTEKLDGTNAQVVIGDDGSVRAGSRNRWITPEDDNYGFAAWVRDNAEDLKRLGPGQHFGEWWGQGIQRRYGLTEKRFSLFNVHRWGDEGVRPKCCHVVPVLARRTLGTVNPPEVLEALGKSGSIASPGFMNPEGIVVFHVASGQGFKMTLGGDGHKGVTE